MSRAYFGEASEALAELAEWAKAEVPEVMVAVDVGGSNTRVALYNPALDSYCTSFPKIQLKSTRRFVEAMGELEEIVASAWPGFRSVGSVIAIAGRVVSKGAEGEITNFDPPAANQRISVSELPTGLFPADKTRFINDLESCCYGILELSDSGLLDTQFQPLWTKDDPKAFLSRDHKIGKIPRGDTLVIGVGTGLGVGLILDLEIDGEQRHVVKPTEFGHFIVNPTCPTSSNRELEEGLFEYFSKKDYNGHHAVEYESICSGPGLVEVFNFLVKRMKRNGLAEVRRLRPNVGNDVRAEDIKRIDILNLKKRNSIDVVIRGAVEYDPDGAGGNDLESLIARESMFIHYKYLMRLCQNIVIALGIKNVFLALDNQVKNDKFVVRYAEKLHKQFFSHQRVEWYRDTSMFRQVRSDYNLNIRGCIHVAKRGMF